MKPYEEIPKNVNEKVSNGKSLSIASLVLGILAICLLGPITGIPAIILGVISISKKYLGKKMAIAGLIAGSIGSISTIIIISIIFVTGSVNQYGGIRERARITTQKMNMHNVATAIETFHAEKGYYTNDFSADGYGAFFPGGNPDANPPEMGKLPANPWTGKELSTDQIILYAYNNPEDVTNTNVGGPNDICNLSPGQIRYGYFIPSGSNRIQLWGLIGIDGKGQSIRGIDAAGENVVIFVLHN